IWIVAAAILIVAALVLFTKNGSEGVKVATQKAALQTITESVSASGKIYPENEVKISPEVSGEIIELTVEEGDSVQKGQLLVKINPAIYSSIVNQAEAGVSQAGASALNTKEMMAQAASQYDLAKATYERNKKLYN